MRRLASHGQRRLARVFTPSELGPRPPRPSRLACVFAVKEAVFKALGRGWGQGMRWNEVRVGRLPGGRWTVRLRGNARKRLAELDGTAVGIAAAAGRGYAAACAVVYGAANGGTGSPAWREW